MPKVPDVLTPKEVKKLKRLFKSRQPNRRPPKKKEDVRNKCIVRERRRADMNYRDQRRLNDFSKSLPAQMKRGERGFRLVTWAKEQGLVPNNILATDKNEAKYLRQTTYKFQAKEKEDHLASGRAHYYQLEIIVATFITKFLPTELNIHTKLLQGISKVALELMGPEFKELWNVPGPKWHKDLLLRLGYRPLWAQGDRDLVDEEWTLRDLHALMKVVADYEPHRIYNCDQTSVEMKDRVETKKYSRNDHVGKTAKPVRESWSLMVAANADGSHKLPLWFFTKSEKPFWLVHAMRYLDQEGKDTTEALGRAARKYVNDVFKRAAHDELEFAKSYPEKLKLATEALEGCNKRQKPARKRALLKLQEEAQVVQEKLAIKKAQKAELLKETKEYMRENLKLNNPATNVLPDAVKGDSFDDTQLKLPMVMPESADTKKLVKLVSTAQNKSNASEIEKAFAKAQANNDLYYSATVADANADPFTGKRSDLLDVRCVRQASAYMDTRTMCLWLMAFAMETKASASNPVLVILDNVWFHDHARRIVQDWPELEGVRVEFLPKNSTSYTQPMDLGIIAALKALAKSTEIDLLNKMTRVDGSVADMSQLRKLNYLDQAWKKVSQRTVANCFKKSPLFFYHDGIGLSASVAKNLEAYEKEQQELERRIAAGEAVPDDEEEEGDTDRFDVTGNALQDANGNMAVSLGEVNVAQAIEAIQDGADGEEEDELEDGVGGVKSGLWYFAAPPRLRPPTILELLAGLSLDDLYEGGREKLMAEYDALIARKRDLDIQATLIKKRHTEYARIERIDDAKRARIEPVQAAPRLEAVPEDEAPLELDDDLAEDDSAPDEDPFDDLPPMDSPDTSDNCFDDGSDSDDDIFQTPPSSPVSDSSFRPATPPARKPFSYPFPSKKQQLFCFPPGCKLICTPDDGFRLVMAPGIHDGRPYLPFEISTPSASVCELHTIPPGSKLFYTSGKGRQISPVRGHPGVFALVVALDSA